MASVGPLPPGLNPFPPAPMGLIVYVKHRRFSGSLEVTHSQDTNLLLKILADRFQVNLGGDSERSEHICIADPRELEECGGLNFGFLLNSSRVRVCSIVT